MQHTTCKCGKYQQWSSGMAPQPCMGCKECGTIPGYPPQKPVQPHEFVAEDVETNEGSRQLDRCRWCHRTRAQVAKMDSQPPAGEGGG